MNQKQRTKEGTNEQTACECAIRDLIFALKQNSQSQ